MNCIKFLKTSCWAPPIDGEVSPRAWASSAVGGSEGHPPPMMAVAACEECTNKCLGMYVCMYVCERFVCMPLSCNSGNMTLGDNLGSI